MHSCRFYFVLTSSVFCSSTSLQRVRKLLFLRVANRRLAEHVHGRRGSNCGCPSRYAPRTTPGYPTRCRSIQGYPRSVITAQASNYKQAIITEYPYESLDSKSSDAALTITRTALSTPLVSRLISERGRSGSTFVQHYAPPGQVKSRPVHKATHRGPKLATITSTTRYCNHIHTTILRIPPVQVNREELWHHANFHPALLLEAQKKQRPNRHVNTNR